jgi:hypothetical protein
MAITALRNLVIAATNELIEKGHIKLDHEPVNNGYLITELFGKTTAINWTGIGHEEIRISVWWDYDHSRHPQAELTGNSRECFQTARPLAKKSHYPKFVGVVASAWFERKESFHLQGTGNKNIFDTYINSSAKESLTKLPTVIPSGYGAEGQFYM